MVKRKKRGGAPNSSNVVDFKKKKQKVGKSKLQARSATNTAFRSQGLSMPKQSVLGKHKEKDKDSSQQEAVTRRKLALPELLLKLRHHSGTVRKDGLWGMRELLLFEAGRDAFRAELPVIVRAIVESCVDHDRDVRRAFVQLFDMTLLQLGRAQRGGGTSPLRPFSRLLAAYLCSALTSLDYPVRMDVGFVDRAGRGR